MRPKRPVKPPEPPPPIPPVVTPEDLDAINTPDIDKLPAYISVGKFQWKSPLPGPKGDQGEPGEKGDPGATARPIVPPVATDEIGDAQVTPAKLSFVPIARPLVPPIDVTELGDDAVETAKIKDGSVTTPKIAGNSVGTAKLKDGSVTPVKLEAVDAPADQEVPVYDLATGKFEWKAPPAPPAGVQMKTGTYTGTGGVQSVTGVGFKPKYLTIYSKGLPVFTFGWKTDQDGGNAGVFNNATPAYFYGTGAIGSLDADGFTVGVSFSMNGMGYTYIALG